MTAPLTLHGKSYCPTCRVGEQGLVILTYIKENGAEVLECPMCQTQYLPDRITEWP